MSELRPCRNLDYTDGKYGPDIALETDDRVRDAEGNPVRYWVRGETWTAPLVKGGDRAPRCVQFCGAGRGRINAIFDCYEPGTMFCYEPPSSGTIERPAEGG